ncbi:MAG: SDR family oxidoreductase [Sphingomonadaceae bacterium]|nr:SDR family oxidoreductase [Sphingomonadaceae bacterium]
MRILLLGAGGFIGRHILSDLLAVGHEVVGVARSTASLAHTFPDARFVQLNLAQAIHVDDWAPHVLDVDVIVNAAGLLRGRDLEAVHVTMPRALYEASTDAGVRRAVLISAISARVDIATDYSQTKLAGEAALSSSTLDWTILRPSLVYGDGSYGGTSLMRGMAGLPFVTPIPGDGEFAFTPIHVCDLARSVRIACEGRLPPRQTLEPVGPETLTLRQMLARYRAWLGFGDAHIIPVPMPLMCLLGRIGDAVGDGPVSSNSIDQMIAGNAGSSAAFADAIGFAPRSLEAALRDRPAQVQDRWHARLFFLAPILQTILILMWLASAWLGLFQGEQATAQLVKAADLPESWGAPLQIGASVLDIAIAAQLLFDRSAVRSAICQLMVISGYTLVIGATLPQLWIDPLGPLLKNIPIMAAVVIYGVIGDKR